MIYIEPAYFLWYVAIRNGIDAGMEKVKSDEGFRQCYINKCD